MKHYFNVIGIFLVASFFLACSFSPASASPENRTIVVFVPDTDWPPYLLNDPSFPGKGVLLDVLHAIATPLGYTVEAVRLPNRRGWRKLDMGEVDAHPKAMEWVDNPKDYYWTDEFMSSETVLLLPKDAPDRPLTPQNMEGMTIAAISSFAYPTLTPLFKQGVITRICVDSPFAMLDLVRMGRADGAAVNRHGTLWLLRTRPELNGDDFKLSKDALSTAHYRFAFTKAKDWRPFIKKFNARLAALKKNGQLAAIIKGYR